jgi:4-hydroxy-tetrahydrodipicolinate reductase
VRVLLNGRRGRVGSVLAPILVERGHELVDSLDVADAMIDFTRPDAALAHVLAAAEAGVPCLVGTSGWQLDAARNLPVAVLYVPNFAVGAVLMMRFAVEARRYFDAVEVVELHHATKLDAPSGTARATAERLGGAPIHAVRLPGLVAHQEVLFGGDGEVLTIRHDTTSRLAFVGGVLLALDRLPSLPAGLTVGLEAVL